MVCTPDCESGRTGSSPVRGPTNCHHVKPSRRRGEYGDLRLFGEIAATLNRSRDSRVRSKKRFHPSCLFIVLDTQPSRVMILIMSVEHHSYQPAEQKEQQLDYSWVIAPRRPNRRASGGGRQVSNFRKSHRNLGTLCAVCNSVGGVRKRDMKLTVDHIIPKNLGGSNRAKNLIVMCAGCNEKKNNHDPFLWYVHLPEEQQTPELFHAIMKAWKNHMFIPAANDNAFF